MSLTLASKVYSQVKEDIFEGVYFENDYMSESQIAEKYNVSKTTAREALIVLFQDGLLQKIPNKGYFVKRTMKKDYDDMLTARYIMESGAALWIIENVPDSRILALKEKYADFKISDVDDYYAHNRAFHTDLVGLTQNDTISAAHNNLMRFLQRPGIYRKANKNLLLISEHHLAIIDALLKRDAEGAVGMLKKDILE